MARHQWVKVPGEQPYYWNLETEETSWSVPDGEEVAWVVQKTANGGIYYWNKLTDETTWDKPPATANAHRRRSSRRGPLGAPDGENDPRFANTATGRRGARLGWKAQQTPEGFAYKATPEVQEPLAAWPSIGAQAALAHETAPGSGKIEPGPMMVVHALRPNNPNGHMVSFADGRMMTKLPACLGGATLVAMHGSAAQLTALAKSKQGETTEAADNLNSRYVVKGGAGRMPWRGGMLAQSGIWDINRLYELNCRFVDPSGYHKKLPMNMRSLQMEAIHTLDGASASFLPGCLNEVMPFCSAVEEFASFEYSSIEAASKRLRCMRGRGLVAASLRVAMRMLSYSWTPGVLACDWTPYLRPKTLVAFRGKAPPLALGGPPAEVPWWQQQAGAPGAPRPPPAMAGPGGKAMAEALNVEVLLQSVRNTVVDILGLEMIEDDIPLMHAGVNSIRPFSIIDSLQALAPEHLGASPEHFHDLATGFEPPPPSAEAAVAKAGEKAGTESEKGCRATATRIRSSASSFYTLMGSTAAEYTTIALSIPQDGAGRGPGLSAQPFASALS